MKALKYIIGIAIVFSVVSSCNKDDDTEKAANNFRTRTVEYNSDINSSNVRLYKYENDKLLSSTYYREGGYYSDAESYRNVVYSYSGNTVTETYQSLVNNTWTDYAKYENTFQEGKQTENIYSRYNNLSWEPQWKDEYKYNNGKLIEFSSSNYNSGVWEYSYKYEFINGNNGVSEEVYYTYSSVLNSWQKNWKSDFEYIDGKISSIISYDYDSYNATWETEENYKDLYIYSGDNLSSKDYYLKETNTSGQLVWTKYYSVNYSYNENNLLSKWEVERKGYYDSEGNYIDQFYTYSYSYTYEKGSGNLKELYYSPTTLYVYNTPTILKAKTIKNKPIHNRMNSHHFNEF